LILNLLDLRLESSNSVLVLSISLGEHQLFGCLKQLDSLGQLSLLPLALTQQAVHLLHLEVMLALKYAQLKLQFTCTLLQRLDQGGQVLNLQILIVFKRVQLLLQPDHFFFKRLFL